MDSNSRYVSVGKEDFYIPGYYSFYVSGKTSEKEEEDTFKTKRSPEWAKTCEYIDSVKKQLSSPNAAKRQKATEVAENLDTCGCRSCREREKKSDLVFSFIFVMLCIFVTSTMILGTKLIGARSELDAFRRSFAETTEARK